MYDLWKHGHKGAEGEKGGGGVITGQACIWVELQGATNLPVMNIRS